MADFETLMSDSKYLLVAFDAATTGFSRKDQIFKLSASTEDEEFLRYIMPSMSLKEAAIERFQFTLEFDGDRRRLLSIPDNKHVETNSEKQTCKEFLTWLMEQASINNTKYGIILLYHGSGTFLAQMLIKALKAHNLLCPFYRIVKCLVNLNPFAKDMLLMENPDYLNIVYLARLNDIADENDELAGVDFNRSNLIYEVAVKIMEAQCSPWHEFESIYDIVKPHAESVIKHMAEMAPFELRDRIKSFRPLLSSTVTISQRIRFYKFTVRLAENHFGLDEIISIWQKGGPSGVLTVLQSVLNLDMVLERKLVKFLDKFFRRSLGLSRRPVAH